MTGQQPGGATGDPQQQWSSAPNPTRRPVLRRVLTVGVAASVFLVALLVLLSILGERLSAQALVTASLAALLPLVVVVPTFLWLDRFEAEPTRYLLTAFLWGSLVAVVAAFFFNTYGLRLLVESRWTDPFETGAVYLAPITEETFKGLGILLIYLLRRREFDGII
ncbi:MAG: rane protein, partial [Humibacillus sp.]|nr:rane protein [Humibacillus sp.]